MSTFVSREMFREFLLEPTKKIYSFYKAHGVELVIHHSDSYGETLIPEMIEAGIDIWQGALSTNNFPEIIRRYQGKLTLMGGIDNGRIDREDWTEDKIYQEVKRVITWADSKYFIPDSTFGGDASTYEGVYDAVTKAIDRMSSEMFRQEQE